MCKFENRCKSENRREIQKNVLKVAKNILSRASCVRQRSECQRFSTLPPFTYPKLEEEREERGSEYKERCSAIYKEEKLGTTILSAVIVEHLSDVNRVISVYRSHYNDFIDKCFKSSLLFRANTSFKYFCRKNAVFPVSNEGIVVNEKGNEVFVFCPFLDQDFHMEHFWISGLIALAFSSWASSKQEYIMETPDCIKCTWHWDTSAFYRFNGFIRTVFSRCLLMTSACS